MSTSLYISKEPRGYGDRSGLRIIDIGLEQFQQLSQKKKYMGDVEKKRNKLLWLRKYTHYSRVLQHKIIYPTLELTLTFEGYDLHDIIGDYLLRYPGRAFILSTLFGLRKN